ncbi:hypothetical protein BKA63DRAFT_23003 [Paraphoma chrysanthemicola]|nr:hypothetical protein BKA63DRAFT_23003 [Paraphoma chrysanthemicola]
MPTRLLDLPSELLFEIIGLITACPYPSIPSGKRYRPTRLQSRAVICFPAKDPVSRRSIRNLELSCRRLQLEVNEYRKKAPSVFKLDIGIVDNHWILPYWRFIPIGHIRYSISSLEINLIYCCTEEGRASSNTSSPAGATEMEILKVISHFLEHGFSTSSFESSKSPGSHVDVRVEHIAINMNTIIIRRSDQVVDEEDIPFRHIDGLAHLSFDQLYPVDVESCEDHLGTLAHITNHALHSLQNALTIRERVDRITFSIDGHLKKDIDIAARMLRSQEARIAEYRRHSIGSSS